MKPERYNKIKADFLALERSTQEEWARMAKDLLAEIPAEGRSSRLKEIQGIVDAALRRRNQISQGYGTWFGIVGELLNEVEAPKGCEKPTEDEILYAAEPLQIRAEMAARFDARKQQEIRASDVSNLENKPDFQGKQEPPQQVRSRA